MRFNEFKIIQEAEASPKYYTIGDSHAVAVATAGGKSWTNLAIGGRSSTDASMLANIAKIPKGAIVLVSQGANDTANAMKASEQSKKPPKDPKVIAANVANVVSKVQAQGATVIFMLFPNGPGRGPGLAKYYGGDYQEDVRSAIKSAINVPVIDINGKPLTDGVHATMGVYREVANEVVTKYKSKASAAEVPVAGKPLAFTIGKISTNRGPEVADLQKSLVALGYPLPKFGVDGIRGPETSGAIRAFQKSNGLAPTGTPDEETVAKLNDTLKSKPEIAAKLTKSTQADVKSKASVAPLELSDENIGAAKESAEKFLGRAMGNDEWDYLLRATVAESSPNTKEQAHVMGVILNRTRSGKWGNSVISVLNAKNQFQAVTGTRFDPGPSANFTRGPNKNQLASILKGAIEILPSVNKSLMNFTAASKAAYGPGTNLGFRDTLLAKGGQQIGGTIFA